MPLWDKPPRRLVEVLRRLARDRRETGRDSVTVETAQAVGPGGVVIKNQPVPITGEAVVRAGERVHVVNVDGRPIAVLAHSARRAQYGPQPVLADQSIVEQLFIARDPDTGLFDIFFRNLDQLTPLGLSSDFAATPTEVFWGTNADVFGVLVGTTRVRVYRLDRNPSRVLGATRARVDALLYEKDLSSLDTLLTTIQFQFDRDSQVPFFRATGTFLQPATWSVMVDRLTEVASMRRSLGIRLDGIAALQFDEEVPNTRRGNATVARRGLFLDENDELLVELRVTFANLGVAQTNPATPPPSPRANTTNVSMTTSQFETIAQHPSLTCPVPSFPITQASTGDTGLPYTEAIPSGSVNGYALTPAEVFARKYLGARSNDIRLWDYFRLSDAHTVLVNASQGTVIGGTLKDSYELFAEDKTEGFRVVFDMAVIAAVTRKPRPIMVYRQESGNTLPGVPDPNCRWQTDGDSDVNTVQATLDVGLVGLSGMVKSDDSLLDAVLDVPAGRRKMFKHYTVDFSDPSSPAAVRNFDPEVDLPLPVTKVDTGGNDDIAVRWQSIWSPGVFARYTVEAREVPFFSGDGRVKTFIGVLHRAAQLPTDGPFEWKDEDQFFLVPENDPHRFGAFVRSGETLITLRDFEDIDEPEQPELISGNEHHVLWRVGERWFISDLDTLSTVQVGTQASDALVDPATGERPGLVATVPDLLYEAQEPRRYFVRGWRGDDITLDQGAANFPPRAPYWRAGLLIDLPDDVVPVGEKAVHAVLDTFTFRDLGVPTE